MPRRTVRLVRGPRSSAPAATLQRLIDRVPDVIFRVRLSPRPRLDYINRAVLGMSGYAPQDWYSDPGLAMRIVHASDRRKLQAIARSRRLPAQPLAVRWTRRDGTLARTEVCVVPVYGRQGEMVALEGVARDVTALGSEAAEVGRHVDRFLRLVFEQLPIGVAQVGADGRFLRANRRLCEITGFPSDELLAKRLPEIADPEGGGHDVGLLQQIRSGELAEAAIETRWVSKDGSPRWVKVTAIRLGAPGSGDTLALVEPIVAPGDRPGEQRRVTYSEIEVDTDRLEVTCGGRRVPLTLKEVLLLRYLIRHRGEMLARDRLLRDVWGYEHAGRSRTLDVHICRLRRKLPPLADSLVTIGHFGYTLSQAAANGQMTVAG